MPLCEAVYVLNHMLLAAAAAAAAASQYQLLGALFALHLLLVQAEASCWKSLLDCMHCV
jgi:hypothetical protein